MPEPFPGYSKSTLPSPQRGQCLTIIGFPLCHRRSCHGLHNRSLRHSNSRSGLRERDGTLGTRRYFRLRKCLSGTQAPKFRVKGGPYLCACLAPPRAARAKKGARLSRWMALQPIRLESQRESCRLIATLTPGPRVVNIWNDCIGAIA